MKELLAEGADINEVDDNGRGVLFHAASRGNLVILRWLLADVGVDVSEITNDAYHTIWDTLSIGDSNAAELSSLLKVMVMLDNAPAYFIARLGQKHADICTRGRQLRAQLPAYLEQQRAQIIAHCALPDVLQPLVIGYAATTPEDMWADGLRIKAPKAKRARAGEGDDGGSHALRRSARLRQKPE
jgi:hypothetical protein